MLKCLSGAIMLQVWGLKPLTALCGRMVFSQNCLYYWWGDNGVAGLGTWKPHTAQCSRTMTTRPAPLTWTSCWRRQRRCTSGSSKSPSSTTVRPKCPISWTVWTCSAPTVIRPAAHPTVSTCTGTLTTSPTSCLLPGWEKGLGGMGQPPHPHPTSHPSPRPPSTPRPERMARTATSAKAIMELGEGRSITTTTLMAPPTTITTTTTITPTATCPTAAMAAAVVQTGVATGTTGPTPRGPGTTSSSSSSSSSIRMGLGERPSRVVF